VQGSAWEKIVYMKVSETIVYPFSAEAVNRMQTDKACREQGARESGALDFSVNVTSEGAHQIVEIDRTMSSERIPEFVRKIIGKTVNIRQTERWDTTVDAQGVRRGHIDIKIKGQPAHMQATMTVRSDGTTTTQVLEGELKVPVPIVGKKIEPEIARAVLGGLHVDQRVGLKWLEENA